MKKINKQKPCPSFEQFVSKKNPKRWEELHPKISSESRLYILCNEQDCLCGYSEIVLEDSNTSSHIDHYYMRDLFPQKTYDWNNLIVSTIDEDFGGKYKDNTYKIKKSDYPNIFNPVLEDMSQYIGYSGDGTMEPLNGISKKDYDKVRKTIEVFNLNFKPLKDRRKALIFQLSVCKDIAQEKILNMYSNQGFTSVIKWYFKR